MIKIEYWNQYDALDCHYSGSYRNRFWIDVDLVTPSYPVDRQGVERSDGSTQNQFLRWEKQYSFVYHCLEHVADMLSTLTLMTDVWVTLPNGYSGKATDFNIDVAWTAITSVAKITCTFTVKSYVLNGASAANC